MSFETDEQIRFNAWWPTQTDEFILTQPIKNEVKLILTHVIWEDRFLSRANTFNACCPTEKGQFILTLDVPV